MGLFSRDESLDFSEVVKRTKTTRKDKRERKKEEQKKMEKEVRKAAQKIFVQKRMASGFTETQAKDLWELFSNFPYLG